MLCFGQSLVGLCNFVALVKILFFGQSRLSLCNFVAESSAFVSASVAFANSCSDDEPSPGSLAMGNSERSVSDAVATAPLLMGAKGSANFCSDAALSSAFSPGPVVTSLCKDDPHVKAALQVAMACVEEEFCQRLANGEDEEANGSSGLAPAMAATLSRSRSAATAEAHGSTATTRI